MIPRETVDKILDSAQIADVVGDFVTLKKRGASYVACCPFHNEKTPSFYVSPAKGIYKCFGCGKAGSAVGFVMEHESLSYVEALKYLAQKYHIEVVEKEETAEEIAAKQKSESLLVVTEFARKFFEEQLSTPQGRAIGYNYFKRRGMEDETIRKFSLGWAPQGRDNLSKAAREAGYKEEFLVETGLSIKRDDGSLSDRFYDRVIFPIFTHSGRVIAFGGRTLKTDKTIAKYVNSPESEIYRKSRTLYGINFAKNEISRQDKCLLVEGYLDVISLHQLGITNAVASSGTSLTVEQVKLIHKFTENVTIIYDGDSAGIHAALRGISLVLKEGLNVKVVLLPDGDDPDSYSRKHTLDEVSAFIGGHEQDFIAFMSDRLLGEAGDDPLKKANLINDVADTIALIPDPVKRSVYVASCSEKFRIEDRILFERIARTREAILVEERKRWQREKDAQRNGGADYGSAGGGNGAWTSGAGYPGGSAGYPGGSAGYGGASWVSAGNGQRGGDGQSAGWMLNDRRMAPCERELLDFILNNGEDPLEFDKDSELYTDEPVTVADFIDSSLAADEEVFANDIYRKIYELYFDYYEEGLTQDKITARLMGNEDQRVVAVTRDLIIPKYELSVKKYKNALTAEKSWLTKYVPASVLAFKKAWIQKRKRELVDRLANHGDGDRETEQELMLKMKELSGLENLIDERLGRRHEKK